jgi:hypothetical protein
MSLSQPAIKASSAPDLWSQLNAADENCPTCDQPIPHARFEEIKETIRARQAEQATHIATRLQDQFNREKTEALEEASRKAAATLAAAVDIARAEERQAADADATKKLADVERGNKAIQAELQTRINQAQDAQIAAEQSGAALRAELNQTRSDHAAAIQKIKEEADANAVTIRADAVKEAEAAVQETIARMERLRQESEAALQARIENVEAEKAAAEQSGTALRAELSQTRFDHAAAIQKIKEEAEANAATIRADAVKEAEAAVQETISGMERRRQESETALRARIVNVEAEKTAAEQSGTALRAELNQTRSDHAVAIQKMKEEADANAETIRADAVRETEAAVQEKIAEMERTRQEAETAFQAKISIAEQAKADADATAVAYQLEMQTIKDAHETEVAQRLNEQREVLEKAQSDAINAQKSASFQKELKLQEKVDQLQHALDNKTAEELGEGAEIDLYELLKREFEGDKIERINKGQPGADVLHTVIHNGKECGSIIYDSKNHNAWRGDVVTKLAADQMAAKAEHAVLSTRKFPAGQRHLHVHDRVILAAPSRILALVQILRQHIVQTHTLRWSNEARAQKTASLYDFINSERCRNLFKRVDTQAEKLLDLQVKEKKAHDANWKTQGELIRSVQKVQAEIINEIDSIVGTAETLGQVVHE